LQTLAAIISSEMNVVFRVDSSNQMGVGHLTRCLTLADELEKKNHNATFICRELKGNLIKSIKHRVFILPVDKDFQSDDLYLSWLGATQEQDAKQTIQAIPDNADLLIVDSYALDEVWHKQLNSHTKKIMVIDDLADRSYDCDILLNQNLGFQAKDYNSKIRDDCNLLLGCEYALLRPQFAELRSKALLKRKNTALIQNILISMGGADKMNVTYDVIKQLDKNLNIVVVLGASSVHKEMIKNYAIDKKIRVVVNAQNMPELMLNADLAIGAGGSSSWERCCLGLPSLTFVLSENQRKVAENLQKAGATLIVKNLANDIKELIENFDLWLSMSIKAQNLSDGFGAKKVKDFLFNFK
jgi:UDP-2,4-diacetamido-2,4,6-trideoxy-beta-L-altropyranose hydrolase